MKRLRTVCSPNEWKMNSPILTIIPYHWFYFNFSFFKIQFQTLSNLLSSIQLYISLIVKFFQKNKNWKDCQHLSRRDQELESILLIQEKPSFRQKVRGTARKSFQRKEEEREGKRKEKKKDEQALERNGRNQNSVCTPQQLSGSHCVHLWTFRSKKGTLFA